MDVHEWHSNTEFISRNKKVFNGGGEFKEKDIINGWHYNRMSMVMYLREKMIKCKDKSLWKNKKGGGEINLPNIEDVSETDVSETDSDYSSPDEDEVSIETLVINSLPGEYIRYMQKHYGLFL